MKVKPLSQSHDQRKDAIIAVSDSRLEDGAMHAAAQQTKILREDSRIDAYQWLKGCFPILDVNGLDCTAV